MRVGEPGQAFSAELVRAIADSGLPIAEVARRSGIRRSRLSDALRGNRHLPVAWLPQLPPSVLRPLLESLASRLGCALTDLPEEGAGGCDAATLAALVRAAADVTGRYAQAVADGRLSAPEGAILIREVNEAIRVLLRVRGRAELAVRERVIGLQ